MVGKLGWTTVAIIFGVLAEFIIYQLRGTFMALWGSGLSEISNTAGHHMIRALATWLPIPLLILVIPGITIAVIIVLWRQP